MRCPRCHGETVPAATCCVRCGAPLALPQEPAARPLDRSLDLDRRGGRPAAPVPPRSATAGGLTRPAPSPLRGEGRGEGSPTPTAAARHAPPRRASVAEEELEPDQTAPLWGLPRNGAVVELRRGGNGRRALAWTIDGLPFGLAVAALIMGLGAGDLAVVGQLGAVVGLASFAYQALAHALAGATLGKRLLGLQVVGPDGERPGPGRSALRAAVAVAGTVLFGAGPLLALFTVSGRGLHDLIAGTAVVDVP